MPREKIDVFDILTNFQSAVGKDKYNNLDQILTKKTKLYLNNNFENLCKECDLNDVNTKNMFYSMLLKTSLTKCHKYILDKIFSALENKQFLKLEPVLETVYEETEPEQQEAETQTEVDIQIDDKYKELESKYTNEFDKIKSELSKLKEVIEFMYKGELSNQNSESTPQKKENKFALFIKAKPSS